MYFGGLDIANNYYMDRDQTAPDQDHNASIVCICIYSEDVHFNP